MACAATLTKHKGNSLFLLFFFKCGFDVLIHIHCQTLWLWKNNSIFKNLQDFKMINKHLRQKKYSCINKKSKYLTENFEISNCAWYFTQSDIYDEQ